MLLQPIVYACRCARVQAEFEAGEDADDDAAQQVMVGGGFTVSSL